MMANVGIKIFVYECSEKCKENSGDTIWQWVDKEMGTVLIRMRTSVNAFTYM